MLFLSVRCGSFCVGLKGCVSQTTPGSPAPRMAPSRPYDGCHGAGDGPLHHSAQGPKKRVVEEPREEELPVKHNATSGQNATPPWGVRPAHPLDVSAQPPLVAATCVEDERGGGAGEEQGEGARCGDEEEEGAGSLGSRSLSSKKEEGEEEEEETSSQLFLSSLGVQGRLSCHCVFISTETCPLHRCPNHHNHHTPRKASPLVVGRGAH